MSAGVISWATHLVNVTGRPHDIGYCPHFDPEGTQLVRWIEVVSGQCVYGTLGAVSWSFGYLSILSWLCAQLPQIITNYQNRSVEGLAPIFLTNWFMGDITNLLGCILTHQLPFQTLLACYYVLVDSVLMFQFVFYKLLFPPRPEILIPSVSSNFHSQHQHRPLSPVSTSAPVKINRLFPSRDFQRSVVSITILLGFVSLVAGEPVDNIPDGGDSSEWLGHIFAWVCCSFYLTSRLPQILENHRRKSTKGINITLFSAALCGNLFYTIGILTNPQAHRESDRKEFLLNALPYLLGSAGTVMFDVTIILQYFRYWGQDPVGLLDREAIKRYLTTDESWLRHRWATIRNKLQFPFSISFHDGPYRWHEEVLDGVPANESSSEPESRKSKDGDERSLLLGRHGSRSYGTQ